VQEDSAVVHVSYVRRSLTSNENLPLESVISVVHGDHTGTERSSET
jgi:hypothetical protein